MEERGFEPRKLAQMIYSHSPLATWVFLRQRASDLSGLEKNCQHDRKGIEKAIGLAFSLKPSCIKKPVLRHGLFLACLAYRKPATVAARARHTRLLSLVAAVPMATPLEV